jgi:molybdenum cofactor sulfurtransferase
VDLRDNLYGNPHSASSPSIHTSRRIESIRLRALQFMKADPDEFDLVFTANATAGIKLLLECLQGHANAENVSLWLVRARWRTHTTVS